MGTGNAINANSTGLVRYNGTGTFDAVTTTQHDILLGAASNGITNLAPSATTGAPLISAGASADPAFSTTLAMIDSTGQLALSTAIVGGVVQMSMTNMDNTANSGCRLTMTNGGTSAGDVYTLYNCGDSASSYESGVVNSDNSYVINNAINASTPTISGTNLFKIASTGTVTIPAGNLVVSRSNVGGSVFSETINTDNTNGASHAFTYILSGGASGGDAQVNYEINGVQGWTTGIDNSDSDKYKLSVGSSLGTNDVIQATTAGNVNFPTSISLAGGTALSNYTEGTWTPTLVGESSAGTTTYTSQVGFYTRIGNLVTVWGKVSISGATGTGNMLFGSLPFTVKNQDFIPGGPIFTVNVGTNFPWPVGTTMASFGPVSNSTNARMTATGSVTNSANVQITNNAGTWYFQATYQI